MERKGNSDLNHSLLTTVSTTLSSELQLYFPICGFVTIIDPCSSPKIPVFEFRDNAHSKYEWFTPNRWTSGVKCQLVKTVAVHPIEISHAHLREFRSARSGMQILIDPSNQKLSLFSKRSIGAKLRSQKKLIGAQLQCQKNWSARNSGIKTKWSARNSCLKKVDRSLNFDVGRYLRVWRRLPYHTLDFLRLEWLVNFRFWWWMRFNRKPST
jgi:hypothetical protein